MKKNFLLFGMTLFAFQSAFAETNTSWYGFILPNWVGSSQGLESFSQPNSSAYTAAGNPALRKGVNDGQSTFQVAQSRIGAKIEKDKDVFGVIEMDFIDFTKASPTTAANPRLRQAFVQWNNDSDWTFKVGQTWDLVSPLAPFSYNYVGHYFESGDIGFMRLQAMALLKKGNFEHGFSLGFPTQNSTASTSGNEMGILPTIAVRETWTASNEVKVGVSALGASLRPDTKDPKRIFAGTGTAFSEMNFNGVKINVEAYVGQNTYNLGMLGLGYGDLTHPGVKEAGGYVSVKAPLGERSSIFGGLGFAAVLNPDAMLSSYSHPTATTSALSGTGPGLERNSTARLGFDHQLGTGLTGFAEFAALFTRHRLLAADVNTYAASQVASVVNLGVMYQF